MNYGKTQVGENTKFAPTLLMTFILGIIAIQNLPTQVHKKTTKVMATCSMMQPMQKVFSLTSHLCYGALYRLMTTSIHTTFI